MSSSAAADALGTLEILRLIFSHLDCDITDDKRSVDGRYRKITLGSQWQSCRAVNSLWKRETDRLVGRELVKFPRVWKTMNEWPVRSCSHGSPEIVALRS